MRVMMGLCTLANIFAFQAQPTFSRAAAHTRATELRVAVDPSVVTKKELDDITGADFDPDVTAKRFQTNEFLYPKHVEVIEDIAPIAGAMVDEIVSDKREGPAAFDWVIFVFSFVCFVWVLLPMRLHD